MQTWLTDSNGNRCSVEKWLRIRGFEDCYEVSSFGGVRSIDRINVNVNGVTRRLRGRPMRTSKDGEGYLQVGLLRNGIEKKIRVHRLVADAFIVNDLGLPLVDHKDRNRQHNHVSNLRWASFSQNRMNTRSDTYGSRVTE